VTGVTVADPALGYPRPCARLTSNIPDRSLEGWERSFFCPQNLGILADVSGVVKPRLGVVRQPRRDRLADCRSELGWILQKVALDTEKYQKIERSCGILPPWVRSPISGSFVAQPGSFVDSSGSFVGFSGSFADDSAEM
jgi:hypothetical protein